MHLYQLLLLFVCGLALGIIITMTFFQEFYQKRSPSIRNLKYTLRQLIEKNKDVKR